MKRVLEGPERIDGAPPRAGDHVGCVRCGYNLFGISNEGVCPECGADVALSVAKRTLRESSPEYVKKLKLGVSLVMAGILGYVLLVLLVVPAGGIAVMAGFGPEVGGIMAILFLGSLAVAVLFAVGWWLFTEPDPWYWENTDGESARRIVRVSVVVGGVAVVVNQALGLLISSLAVLMPVLAVVGWAAWIVWYFASLAWVIQVGRRVPDEWVQRRARLLRWRGPLLVLVLLGAGLVGVAIVVAEVMAGGGVTAVMPRAWLGGAMFVALLGAVIVPILYCDMLARLRKSLTRVLREQRA